VVSPEKHANGPEWSGEQVPLKPVDVVDLVKDPLMPAFLAERKRLDRIDRWWRWDHDKPHSPRQSTKEYRTLSERSQTPWLNLVVTSVAQHLYIDGYRQEGEKKNASPWQWWQANGMDARQVPLHRAALAYGHAYGTVLPGETDFGDQIPVMKNHSPRRMIAFYREPEHDDWPTFALRADPAKVDGNKGWALKVYDEDCVYYLNCDSGGANVTYISYDEHGLGICPVVRFANNLDLEGRTPGEVEPFISVASRIDQTTYDRIVVQRFASWVVRTIAGMAKPDSDEEAAAKRLQLMVDEILIAEDPDTKFGSLEATPLGGFIEATEADIRVLAAVSQTPAHEMLGQMANLSAEALAAARASQTAKVEERKLPFGEAHEQRFRLAAHVMGDVQGRSDVTAQVKWRDTSIRSLAQAADALGKLATMLSFPVELLWEKIPGLTQQDVDAAKAIIEKGDSLIQLRQILEQQASDAIPA
jgi:hypothetical protein